MNAMSNCSFKVFGLKRFCFILSMLVFVGNPLLTTAQSTSIKVQARSLINLLDYISVDYGNAVKDGEVISASEFQEMNDFSAAAIDYFDAISKKKDLENEDQVSKGLASLSEDVKKKDDIKIIAERAQEIKKIIISYNLVDISPTTYPSIKKGKQLYMAHCQSCHGKTGAGDGPAGVALNPPPADLLDTGHMKKISAMQVFNTVRLGVEGTAMQAYDKLSDKEVWDVTFFVKSLIFKESSDLSKDSIIALYSKASDSISLSNIAVLSDEDLSKKLPDNPSGLLAAVRLYQPDKSKASSLDLAISKLDEALNLYKEKNYNQARHTALFAYLNGVEPVEKQLLAIDSKIVTKLESHMNAVRASIRQRKSIAQVQENMNAAKATIKEAKNLLGEQVYSFWFSFLIAASILLREGLEAVLIIVTILGLLRSMKAKKAINWVHGGWLVALGIGIGSWFFTEWLLSFGSQNTEVLEAVGSLIAVVILIYVGFWLHNKTDAKKWQHFIKTKVTGMLDGKKLFGLAFISFIVVFREAFESILFLSSLQLQVEESNQGGILFGAVSAIVAVIIIAFLLLKFSVKVPIKKLFQYSSVIIMIFAVVLAGQGVHAFQEAGYVSVSSFPINFHASALGIYPTIQTYTAQVVVLLLIVAMTQIRKRNMRKKEIVNK